VRQFNQQILGVLWPRPLRTLAPLLDGVAAPMDSMSIVRITLLREAEEEVDRAKATNEVPLDCIFVIEAAMRHFFLRAETGKASGRGQQQVDEDYKQAAAMVAPYRHARLSAIRLAGVPNNPVSMIPDDLSTAELRAEVNKHIARLDEAGVLDLEALLGSKRRMAN
jgi:hypothetical protein